MDAGLMASLLVPSKRGYVKALANRNHLLYVVEALVSDVPGVAQARNDLANRAIGEILIYLDDDYAPSSDIWDYLVMVPPGYLVMTQGRNNPISRAMSLHKSTFHKLGGFDPKLTRNAEDLDLYMRARAQGIPVVVIPNQAEAHNDHPRPFSLRAEYEGAYVRVKNQAFTLTYLITKHPVKFLVRLATWTYYQIRKMEVNNLENGS